MEARIRCTTQIPYVVKQWRQKHPKQDPEDQMVLAQPWLRGTAGAQYKEMIYGISTAPTEFAGR